MSATPARNLVNLKDVRKGFAARTILDGVTLGVAEGDRIGVVGRNGEGKSTLLRLVAGLDTPTTGRIMLYGKKVDRPGPDRGMVFQSYTLFPWLAVADNIAAIRSNVATIGFYIRSALLQLLPILAHRQFISVMANRSRRPIIIRIPIWPGYWKGWLKLAFSQKPIDCLV